MVADREPDWLRQRFDPFSRPAVHRPYAFQRMQCLIDDSVASAFDAVKVSRGPHSRDERRRGIGTRLHNHERHAGNRVVDDTNTAQCLKETLVRSVHV